MRDMRIPSICFETDYSDLVDMTVNPMDWPAFASKINVLRTLHEESEELSLIHILRARNGRENSLAKESKTRGCIFSHINQT